MLVLLVLLVLLIVWLGPGDGGIAARVARQRDLGRAGQRHRGVEHALFLHQRIERRGIGLRQPYAAMGSGGAEPVLEIGAVDRMADLGEEDRVRHRRVVEFLGVVVFLHPEGAEAAARRLVGRNAGGDRPVVALDAVDRDGHLLRILVDGDGDIGLGGAGGEQHQASESNEEGTHLTLASRP